MFLIVDRSFVKAIDSCPETKVVIVTVRLRQRGMPASMTVIPALMTVANDIFG